MVWFSGVTNRGPGVDLGPVPSLSVGTKGLFGSTGVGVIAGGKLASGSEIAGANVALADPLILQSAYAAQ